MTVKELLLITMVLPFFITACSDKYSEQDKIQAINNGGGQGPPGCCGYCGYWR